MKRLLLLLVIGIIVLVGCSPKEPKLTEDEKKDIEQLGKALQALRENPDEGVLLCNDFIGPVGKEICYTTYLGLKMSKNESVDGNICQYIVHEKNIEAKELCLEYTK